MGHSANGTATGAAGPAGQQLLDTYAWRWGATRYADMLDIAKDFTLDPARITCPLLSIVGEKEYASSAVSRRFQDDAITANPDPRSRLIIVKACDGGDAHAMGTNLSLMAQLVFDWLDEIVPAKPSMNASARDRTAAAS